MVVSDMGASANKQFAVLLAEDASLINACE